MAKYQMKKVSWWYEAIVTWEIANPGGKRGDLAREVNCSESHLSVISNSDAFREYREMRMIQHRQAISEGIVGKLESVTDKALEKLDGVLDHVTPTSRLTDVNDVAKMGLQALGLFKHGGGAIKSGPGAVTVNIGVTAEGLAEARERMRTVNGGGSTDVVHEGELIEAEGSETEMDAPDGHLLPAPSSV